MKRLMAIFLTLLCVLSVIGCRSQQPDGRGPASDSAEAGQFSFFYQLEKTAYQAGERIEIKATITNNTGKDYTYTGSYSEFSPEVSLYYISDSGERLGHIEHEPRPMTDDMNKHVIANGERRTATYSFTLPENAVHTEYSITLSYGGQEKEFENVLYVFSASDQVPYKVEFADDYGFSIINDIKETYLPGETVLIELGTVTEHYYVVRVNGVQLSPDETVSEDWTSTYYTFIMPNKNVMIEIEDRWVDIPLAP